MRPPVLTGEIFAVPVLRSGNAVELEYYVAVNNTPAGKPIIVAQKLVQKESVDGKAEFIAAKEEPTVVLAQYVVAFFGVREPAAGDPAVYRLDSDEPTGALRYATTGHMPGGYPNVKPHPIGSPSTALPSPASPSGGLGAVSPHSPVSMEDRQLRGDASVWLQIRSLVRKDWVIAKSSKCGLCCGECCLPGCMMLAVILLVVFLMVVPVMMGSTNPFSGYGMQTSWRPMNVSQCELYVATDGLLGECDSSMPSSLQRARSCYQPSDIGCYFNDANVLSDVTDFLNYTGCLYREHQRKYTLPIRLNNASSAFPSDMTNTTRIPQNTGRVEIHTESGWVPVCGFNPWGGNAQAWTGTMAQGACYWLGYQAGGNTWYVPGHQVPYPFGPGNRTVPGMNANCPAGAATWADCNPAPAECLQYAFVTCTSWNSAPPTPIPNGFLAPAIEFSSPSPNEVVLQGSNWKYVANGNNWQITNDPSQAPLGWISWGVNNNLNSPTLGIAAFLQAFVMNIATKQTAPVGVDPTFNCSEGSCGSPSCNYIQPLSDAATVSRLKTSVYGNFYPMNVNYINMASMWIACVVLFGMLPSNTRVAARLVDEKREGMREHLRVMGCGDFAYLAGTYLSTLIRLSPATVFYVIAFRALWWGGVDCLFVFLSLLLYTNAMTGFNCMMPVAFSSTTWAMVLMFFTGLGSIFTSPAITTLPVAVQLLLALLFPNVAAWYAITQSLARQTTALGVSLTASLLLLLAQALGYGVLSQWLYKMFPGQYGISASPIACLTKSAKAELSPLSGDEHLGAGDELITLRKLRKWYGEDRNEIPAVNLSLGVNKGEILALLGHNGSGKTTTLSMMTGILAPTDYERATVAGLDISTSMSQIRNNIAICPQHDVLFPTLSARDHLVLFANLRGVKISAARVDELLMFLELPLDATRVSEFSGGMKRRVSVACALVGNPLLVMLDEPTTGLDEVSRQKLWELLKIERNRGTTMILTTHMMEEAEHLGDRIAIMSAGELHSLGSAMELKQKYGSGRYLNFSKGAKWNPRVLEDALREFVPNFKLQRDSLQEATYFLPADSEHHAPKVASDGAAAPATGRFDYTAALLETIEGALPQIGATSYGLSISTLEDVFIAVAEGEGVTNTGIAKAKASDAREERSAAAALPVVDSHDRVDGVYDEPLLAEEAHGDKIPQVDPTQAVETVRRLLDDPSKLAVFDAAAQSVSLWAKGFCDLGTVMAKRLTMMRFMKSQLVLQVIFPVLLCVAAVYAAFCTTTGSNDRGSYRARPYNFEAVTVPVLVQNAAPEGNAAVAQQFVDILKPLLVASFATQFNAKDVHVYMPLYLNYHGTPDEEKQARRNAFDFSNGGYLVQTKLGYVPTADTAFTQIVIAGDDASEMIVSLDSNRFNEYTTGVYAAVGALSAKAFAEASVRVRGNGGSAARPLRIPAITIDGSYAAFATDLPTQFTDAPDATPVPTPAPTLNTTNATNVTQPCDKNTWPTGLILVFTVMCQQLPSMIVINDELQRGVLDTMMAHGLVRLGYWIGNFLFDTVFCLVVPLTLTIAMYATDFVGFEHPDPALGTTAPDQLTGLFFFMFLYCLVMQLWTYCLMVTKPTWQLGSHVMASLGMTLAFWVLPVVIVMPISAAGVTIHEPGYPMLESITPTSAMFFVINYKLAWNRWTNPSGAIPFMMMLLHACFPLVIMASAMFRRPVSNGFVPASDGIPADMFMDVDVARELQVMDEQCKTTGRPDRGVAANHAWKKYKDGKVAVKGVTFGVHWGECFGLLGSNGAGKSTTMRMLQLEIEPSGGAITFGTIPAAHYESLDVTRQLVRQGVCQQHDTLCGPLTGEEHLHLYLKLRLGSLYHPQHWNRYIDEIMQLLSLPPHRRAERYSGGMKRKLATAIALFTGARLVFLDEPSTGLDPYARRVLWRMISAAAARPTTSTVLTTHSMEEADAVCTRISIVTEGQMRCIGNTQHLKSRFGSGYIASLVLTPESDADVIDREMKRCFGDSCSPHRSSGQMRTYTLGNLPSLAAAYRTLEACAPEWHLDRFSVSQATLQQVFVAFAQNTVTLPR